MACDVPVHDWRSGISRRRVGSAVVAGTMAAVAIALDTDQAANLLLLAAGLVLAAGFAIPMATAAAGGPPIGNLVAAVFDQGQKSKKQGLKEQFLDRITSVTLDVTLLEPRAIQLANGAIDQALDDWRGPRSPELYKYLLCCAVRSALSDAWQDPPIGDDHPLAWLARLPRRQRAIWTLRHARVNATDIADILDCSLEEVAAVPYPRQWNER